MHIDQTTLVLVAILFSAVALFAAVLLGRRIDIKVGKIHAQVTPNGGHSMHDKVDQLNTKVDGIDARVTALESAGPASEAA